MASHKYSKEYPMQFGKLSIVLALMLLLTPWLQCTHAINPKTLDHPVVLCGPVDNSINKVCLYGGYIINPNRTICRDRYVCYGGPDSKCSDNDDSYGRCLPELVCKCGICQNCYGDNCKMVLCREENNILKKWLKRFEKNLLEYNA